MRGLTRRRWPESPARRRLRLTVARVLRARPARAELRARAELQAQQVPRARAELQAQQVPRARARWTLAPTQLTPAEVSAARSAVRGGQPLQRVTR